MPQLSQFAETLTSQIFWLLIIFGLVFFVVGRRMVPKVMDTIDSRDGQIAADLAAAEAARSRADEEEEAWRTRENENRSRARALIEQARTAAAEKTAERLAAAQEGIDSNVADAEARIANARNAAAAEIETVASEAAQDIVARLAGVDVAPESAAAAVKKALTHG